MGKSTKPTKWFKAVKKAFRSPSKERPSPQDKGGAEEILPTKQDFPPVSYPAPTPQPLPSFEVVTHDKVERQQHSHVPPPSLPSTPDHAVSDPAMSVDKKPAEGEEPEQQHYVSNGNIYSQGMHQDNDDDSTLSEEDEAAARIQQRFLHSPLALKGLIRLQAMVRGQLVRRQAATTLRTMEAIVRLQALFRGRRIRMSSDGRAVKNRVSRIQRLGSQANKGAKREGFQEMESETSEAEHEANKRKRRTAYLLTQQLKRSTPNRSSSFIDCDPDQPHEGWTWLELWTNAKAWESRQLEAAAAQDPKLDAKDFIEIIPGQSRRTTLDYSAVKEVDGNTLKPQYYENGTSNSNLDGTSKALQTGTGEEEEQQHQGFISKKLTSPNLTTPSPAVSEEEDEGEDAANRNAISPSPPASQASIKQDSHNEDPSSRPVELDLPEVANGSPTLSDSFSTSNGVHQSAVPGAEVAANGKVPDSEVANGTIAGNGNYENGDCNKTRKEESPVPSKRTTCRYMAATESAKAKFRSSSNPKTRDYSTPEAPELRGQAAPKQRHSTGDGAATHATSKAAESPGKTPVAFGTRKTTPNGVQKRRSPSPRTLGSREKPRSMDAGHGGISPARRNSLGTGDDKRWRT